jgi:hypothetical protein
MFLSPSDNPFRPSSGGIVKSKFASAARTVMTKRLLVKLIVQKVFKMVKFVYSLFIAVQLIYLGYAEGIRIKNMLAFMINNSKKIRIKENS